MVFGLIWNFYNVRNLFLRWSISQLENVLRQAVKNGLPLSISNIFHLLVWSQFAFGSLPPPPPWNQTFLVGSFGYFHLVGWSQFAFGNLPPPPQIGHLWLVCFVIYHLVVWSQFAFVIYPPPESNISSW